jgi:DNA polymerase-4
MLPPPSTKLIAHVDMNSYFASVEQQANVELRGKPLGVCSYLQPFGCVIAASIEAKRRGMKVGMNVKEARKLIPDASVRGERPAKVSSRDVASVFDSA